MKQAVNKRRRELCQKIINSQKLVPDYVSVRAAFMNGRLPHGICLAWTGPRDAFLVNFKKKTAKEYVRDGKFLLKRVLPIRIKVPKIPALSNECPGCVNSGFNLTHNQFCDRLKVDPVNDLEKRYAEVDQYFD